MARPPRNLLLLALLAGASLSACGSTQQATTISNRSLQSVLEVDTGPVYWVGGSFHGLPLSAVLKDAAGSYTVQYGTCRIGGQTTCVTPLEIVTVPVPPADPGASSLHARTRGVPSVTQESGRAITLATGSVTVHIYARTPLLARNAAAWMVPLNRLGDPRDALPAPAPASVAAPEPLPGQLPRALRMSHGRLRLGPIREGSESEAGGEGGEEETIAE